MRTSSLNQAVADQDINRIISLLDDKNTDPNEIDNSRNKGYTPLIWAIEFDRPDIVRLLLEKNASPNAVAGGSFNSPLLKAVRKRQEETVKLLVAHPSIELEKDNRGFGITPLDEAIWEIEKKSISIVSLLLKHGALIKDSWKLFDFLLGRARAEEIPSSDYVAQDPYDQRHPDVLMCLGYLCAHLKKEKNEYRYELLKETEKYYWKLEKLTFYYSAPSRELNKYLASDLSNIVLGYYNNNAPPLMAIDKKFKPEEIDLLLPPEFRDKPNIGGWLGFAIGISVVLAPFLIFFLPATIVGISLLLAAALLTGFLGYFVGTKMGAKEIDIPLDNLPSTQKSCGSSTKSLTSTHNHFFSTQENNVLVKTQPLIQSELQVVKLHQPSEEKTPYPNHQIVLKQ